MDVSRIGSVVVVEASSGVATGEQHGGGAAHGGEDEDCERPGDPSQLSYPPWKHQNRGSHRFC